MKTHQQQQIEVINQIEKQVKNRTLNFSTVSPVEDYDNDSRICLTSVHLPSQMLIVKIKESIINLLKEVEPDYYYYSDDSLHMTIKNIRVINDPPHFIQEDVLKAKKVFSEVMPKHKKFKVYFYRLLLFPANLALMGTTDPELDEIFLDLDRRLKAEGIPDDKKYSNPKHIFSNMTLARFSNPSDDFKHKVEKLSNNLAFEPYTVDSVTLLSCNAVFKKRKIISTWKLN